MTQTLSLSKTRPGPALPVRLGLALAEFVILTALAYVCARLIWLIAFGASATDFQLGDDQFGAAASGRPAYVADLTRLRDADPFADRRAVPADAEPVAAAVQETQLNLVLRGIRRGATADSGGAIVQTPDNRQSFFRAGQSLLDGVMLEEVHVDHILIRRRGVLESLYLRDEDGGAGRAVSSGPAAAPARTGTQEIAGLFRAEPVREGNAVTGYRIAEGNAAMLSAMGLRNGDVITAIDGRAAADISDLPALFRSLREREAFALTINRGGLPLTVQVDLPR